MFFVKLIGLLLLALTLASSAESGGGMDPNGKPATQASRCGDEGNGLDPHGQPCPRP
jgi:hypothetical protein